MKSVGFSELQNVLKLKKLVQEFDYNFLFSVKNGEAFEIATISQGKHKPDTFQLSATFWEENSSKLS